MQREGEVVGDLSSHGDNNALRVFKVGDVLHALQGELFKIEPVRFIVIGGDGFWIGIDDDRSCPISKVRRSIDRTPIEFDRRADAIGAGADTIIGGLLAGSTSWALAMIGEIEIVGLGVKLASQRVDLFDNGTMLTFDCVPALFLLLFLNFADRLIGKAQSFGFLQQGGIQKLFLFFFHQAIFLQMVQKPGIDVR